MSADQTHPEAALDARSLVQELTEVRNDPVDVAELPVGVLFADGWESAGGRQNSRNRRDSVKALPLRRSPPRTVKKRSYNAPPQRNSKAKELVQASNNRMRFKFANQSFFGSKEIFLRDEYKDLWPPNDSVNESTQLLGKIVSCPSSKNGHKYNIRWFLPPNSQISPSWLNPTLQNNIETKKILQAAIQEFQSKDLRTGNSPAGTATVERGSRVLDVSTPPPNIRAQFVANLRTSVHTEHSQQSLSSNRGMNDGSTIANLSTNNQIQQSLRAGTRNTTDLDSSSDEEEDIIVENLVEDPSRLVDPFGELEEDVDDEDDALDNRPTNTPGSPAYTTLKDYLDRLCFRYAAAPPGRDCLERNARPLYSGPEGLRPNILLTFADPFECLSVCGGLDRESVARLTAGSNDYFHQYIKPTLTRHKVWHHLQWTDITIEEMYRFLGIMLRMSITPVDGGGYKSYFSIRNRKVSFSRHSLGDLEISDTAGFAHKYMSLQRFQQIRGSFHPEDKSVLSGGDKCYQIRYIMNSFNAASKQTWYVPGDVTFDEGGVGCRSRYCPVRQYNKDKPQKYRVDFFIMAASKGYYILHLDVYQGKNESNIGISSQLVDLPTTQKAVANACYRLGFHHENQGMRHLSIDNRYQCPQLAVLLRERFNCYSTGTCRAKRIGFPTEMLEDCSGRNKKERGFSQMFYDKENRLIVGQWLDSKMVKFVSTLNNSKIIQVERQVGSSKKTISCPAVVKKYQEDMGSIDKNDQMRLHGGGFSAQGHFKKWYKRVYLAILDTMMLNALFAWNASVTTENERRQLDRHEFLAYIAETMMNYKDSEETSSRNRVLGARENPQNIDYERKLHVPIAAPINVRCVVCRLELYWHPGLSGKGVTRGVARCASCGVVAHPCLPSKLREIHKYAPFDGMSCFEIVHSTEGRDIWKQNGRKFYVNKNHAVVKELKNRVTGISTYEDLEEWDSDDE